MKFVRVLLIFILFFVPQLAKTAEIKLAPKEIIEDYLNIADNYAFLGEYQKALEYIDMVIHFEPMNSMAKYKQALLLTSLNKTEEAKEAYTQAIKLNPELSSGKLAEILAPAKDSNNESEIFADLMQENLGSSQISNKEEISVKTEFQNNFGSDLEKEPELYSSEYYNKLGLQFLGENNNSMAYEYLQKAIELDKKNYDAHNSLGLFYWQQGENKLAEKAFKKSAKLNINSNKPLLNLALLYKENKDDKKSLQHINKALELTPNDYLANWIMGNYQAEKHEYKSAIKSYTKSIDNNTNFYDGYISLGNVLAENNRFEEAYAVFEKALTVKSDDAELYYMLSKTASIIDKPLEAKHYILEGIELAPSEKLYFELAKINMNQGDYEEALLIFDEYFKNTQEPTILNYIGLAYYKLKEPKEAIKYFNKLIQIDTSKSIYYYNLALCYKSLGDRKSFFKHVDTATKILPRRPQDYIDLSYIYFDNGNNSYALNILNEGLLKYPEDKKLYFAKLSLFKNCGDTKNYVEFKATMDAKFGAN